ncbi:cell adhesion molecule Dscam1-like [Ornithodoros turicata]|uniref:cell adhesion molecule Dscam1-like n=1 Tax=Ornithodoros turicata TaxID=34597 RepID=UPI003139F890
MRTHVGLCVRIVVVIALVVFGSSRAAPQQLGPRFTNSFPSKAKFSNSTGYSVHCGATGQPTPTLTWLLPGDRVASAADGLRIVLPNGTLYFPPFSAAQFRQDIHSTTYRCRASNLFGTVLSTHVKLRGTVQQYYEVLVYDEFTIAGNTVVLRCHVPSFVKDDVTVVAWEQKLNGKINVLNNGKDFTGYLMGVTDCPKS